MKSQKTLRARRNYLNLCLALMHSYMHRVKAEEVSVLNGATVSTATLSNQTPDGDVFLNGSFKSFITGRSKTNPINIQVDLPQPQIIVSVVILAASHDSLLAATIGSSQIVLVDSAGVEIVAKNSVYDTGIYTLDSSLEATSIIFRRMEGVYYLKLSHMRAYQSTNLMQYATVHYATPSLPGYEAQNLIDNQESRSSSSHWNARIGLSQEYLSTKSCYTTDGVNIAIDGNQMQLVFDLGIRSFIHAMLMIDDLKSGHAFEPLYESDKRSLVQNISIYIGNDSENAQNNQLCAGGPFLNIDDPQNFFEDPSTFNNQHTKAWKYGDEKWCNLEGRYVHVISNKAGQEQEIYEQSICSLGIFGTIYKRDHDLEQSISVEQGQTTTITVPHIYADPTRPIGNILAINVRQTSSLKVTITHDSSDSILTIDTSGIVTGTHDLVIESFDANSSVQSALKTDLISIQVIEKAEEDKPETELVAESEQEIEIEKEVEIEKDTELIEASFEYELTPLSVQADQTEYFWQLPPIIKGSEPIVSVTIKPDTLIATFISFDEASRTIIFRGTAKEIQYQAGLFAKIHITIEDGQENLVEYTQGIMFQTSILQSESEEESEQECEETNQNGITNCDAVEEEQQEPEQETVEEEEEEGQEEETISEETTQDVRVDPAQNFQFSFKPPVEQKINEPQAPPPVEKIKLSIDKMKMNSQGQLSIKFNKEVLNLSFDTQQNNKSLRGLKQGQDDIQNAIWVKEIDGDEQFQIKVQVQNADDDFEQDKSIGSVQFAQKLEGNETIQELTLEVVFNDIKALTQDVREPDALMVELFQPGQTDSRNSDSTSEFTVGIVKQMSQDEFVELVAMVEAAANVGIGLSIWQIIICLVLNKVINSMWILINAAQFLVYIGMWQINYSTRIGVLVKEIKRIFLGEYLEDLEIGHKMSSVLGIESNSDVNDPDEKIGDERLGSDQISANFGITFILATFVFLLIIGLILTVILISRRTTLSQKNRERKEKLKKKIFYNPMIRFAFLGSLKFNLSSMLAFKSEESSPGQTFIALVIFIGIAIAVPVTLAVVLYKNRASLQEERTVQAIGTIYQGRRLQSTVDTRRVWIYPLTYFCRRTIFIGACVFLLEHPNMQMIVHQFLTMATLVYLCNDGRMFENESQKVIEIVTEILLLIVSMLLQQFIPTPYSEELTQNIDVSVLIALGLLVMLNIVFLIYSVIINRKEKKRSKAIEAAKKAHQEAVAAANKEKSGSRQFWRGDLMKSPVVNSDQQQKPSLLVIDEVSDENNSSFSYGSEGSHSEPSQPQEAATNIQSQIVQPQMKKLPAKKKRKVAKKSNLLKPKKTENTTMIAGVTQRANTPSDDHEEEAKEEVELVADEMQVQNKPEPLQELNKFAAIDQVIEQYEQLMNKNFSEDAAEESY